MHAAHDLADGIEAGSRGLRECRGRAEERDQKYDEYTSHGWSPPESYEYHFTPAARIGMTLDTSACRPTRRIARRRATPALKRVAGRGGQATCCHPPICKMGTDVRARAASITFDR